MFANTMPNWRSVQTLVQDALVYRAPNGWSLSYARNECCFHLLIPAPLCFAGATRRREHRGWTASQIRLHMCANLFQRRDQVSTRAKHFRRTHELGSGKIARWTNAKNSISRACRWFNFGLTSRPGPLMPSQTSYTCRRPASMADFQCPECDISFTTSHQRDGHRRSVHRSTCKIRTAAGRIIVDRSIDGKFPCPSDRCARAFSRSDKLQSHFKVHRA
jgi:hypothetical protein